VLLVLLVLPKLIFGKPVFELNLEEAAYLASLAKTPTRSNLVGARSRAIERRNFVISQMLIADFIVEGDATEASLVDIILQASSSLCLLEQ